ncbi:hypothetical protein HGRIS_005060 [Hohenbuehelia grisea]|uniref:Amine oxidase n=1 Tax=Hohenbuehelia grisea TaxID=104357 RepID=A0ABR3JET7_9AGAR
MVVQSIDRHEQVANNMAESKAGTSFFRRTHVRIALAAVGVIAILSGPLNSISSGSSPALLVARDAPDAPEGNSKQCPSVAPKKAKPPAPANLWLPLSSSEINDINTYLVAPERNLNLTVDNPVLSDNHVFLIELLPPAKADALAYLAEGGSKPAPARYAHLVVHHGAASPPSVKDYELGPLPVGPKTTMKEREIYHNTIPYDARGVSLGSELGKLLGHIMPPIADTVQALLGGTSRGNFNDTLTAGSSGPWSFDGAFRRTWLSWKRNISGSFINPVNLYLYVDFSGTDPALWKILKLVYDNKIFSTVEDFLEAFRNGTIKAMPEDKDIIRPDGNTWSSRHRPNASFTLDLDHLPGPRSVSFAGLRFRVDPELQYISWMGWGMYIGFDRDMGVSLWDIRLRGERIIYQLAPQEAIAQYAGYNPFQSTTAWLDRFFGMGSSVRPLMPGYDCPSEAVYMPVTTYTPSFGKGPSAVITERAICVFEMDSARPISRHNGWAEGEFGAVKGYTLTVRSIATVGNYDYLGVSASGYLQGAFYEPQEDSYGTQIHHSAMGSLHDHVINFKVDLDIGGTSNSLLRTTTLQETVTQPWHDEDWGDEVIQAKVTREYIDNEDQAKIKYGENFQSTYAVVNKDNKNSWGRPRGYAIHPGVNPVHNMIVGSKRLFNNANWAKYNIAVSKHKESEPSSSSMWNQNLPGAPPVDFDRFFNGEGLAQEDLVAWVNVGTHHLPQAEDVPNTRTSLATSSFFITPLNYFDSDISMDSRNAIMISYPDSSDGKYTFDNYGVDQSLSCMPHAPAPFEYSDISAIGMDGENVGVEVLTRMISLQDASHRIIAERV